MSAVPNIPLATPGCHEPNQEIPRPAYKLKNVPVENTRPLKVIVIGAGFSGIYCGIRIPEKLRNVELKIFEKNSGVGGTWWENRYMGCACDVPSHSYQFSFEPNPDWSSIYAPAKEIQAYLEGVTKKYSVDRFIHLSHEIKECRWNESLAKWYIVVQNLVTGKTFQEEADVLISARGALNDPSWPTIDGLDTFKGELMHSSKWNENYDYSNKRIGVIGSGSSSIQIVPSLQRLAGTHVTVFARSKTWISPSFGQTLYEKYGLDSFEMPVSFRERFAVDPEYFHKFRLAVEEDGNSIHSVTIQGTELQKGAKDMFYEHMKQRLASKPDIFEALVPSFSPGCRRLTPGPGYLESLTQENVSFITSPITHISESAVHTSDGATHDLDTLVCATGFKVGSAPPFPIHGRDDLPLSEKWADRPVTYLSHSVSNFPNLFLMLGPNSAIGSGSLTFMIENIGDYIIRCVRKIQKDNIAAMEVKSAREEDFIEYVDAYFQGTVFGEECRSWYKNERKQITGLWPGSNLHCVEALRSPRWEDFEYVYVDELEARREDGEGNGSGEGTKGKRVNRLAWLGNGWSVNQIEGRDLAWYLYPEMMEKPVAPRPEENERYTSRTFSY